MNTALAPDTAYGARADDAPQPILAFTGGVSRERLLGVLRHAAEHEQFLQGVYWDPDARRGCAIGCALHHFHPGRESERTLYAETFRIPEALAVLEEALFEALPPEQAPAWPVRFTEAIAQGSDLSLAVARWARWMVAAPDSPLARWRTTAVAQQATTLYTHLVRGTPPDDHEWFEAENAAFNARLAARHHLAAHAGTPSAAELAAPHAFRAIAGACALPRPLTHPPSQIAPILVHLHYTVSEAPGRFWSTMADRLVQILSTIATAPAPTPSA